MSLFKLIQSECVECLQSKEFFSDSEAATPVPIPVLAEHLKDIASQIEITVAQLGLCVVIATPFAAKPYRNAKLFWEEITVAAIVYNNPVINTTLPGAAVVAEAAAFHLHMFLPDLGEGVKPNALVLSNGPILTPSEELPGSEIYTVTFKTMGGLASAPTRN